MNHHHTSFSCLLQGKAGKALRGLVALLVVFVLAIALTKDADAGFVRSSFLQCSNQNNTLGQCKWIGSNVQDNNSVYIEGMALAQRVYYDGVTNRAASPQTTHVITWNTQWTKGSRHAYDWLVSYAQAQALSTAVGGFALTMNYCSDLSTSGQSPTETDNCNAVYPSGNHVSVSVPDDSYVSGQCDSGLCNTQDRINAFEALFGNRTIDVYTNQPVTATLTQQHKNCTAGSTYANGADSGDQEQCWTLTLVPTNTANPPTVILIQAAGHISAGWDPQNQNGVGWGGQFSAGNISGSPYHFKDIKLDGSGGSQDNQLNATAIPPRPTLSTSVSTTSVTYPTSFRDNATVVGTSGLGAPQGKVYFYVCGPTPTPTACNTNTATVVSSNTLTTGANNTSTTQSSFFTPTQNITGYYCFAIGYLRTNTNPPGFNHYSNETQTTTTNECVLVTAAATAANLVAFHGERTEKGAVRVRWQTGTELNTLGFNVWRKTKASGWEKITTDPLPAKYVGSIGGGTYKFTDRNAITGQTQKYKIELVTPGRSEWSDVVTVK
jgi:hypothetical protein